MFGSKPSDRARVLADADAARAKGKLKKAVAGYREILSHEPRDAVVHGKLAPLLVREEPYEAWQGFELAAQDQLQKGFAARAIALYRTAAQEMRSSSRPPSGSARWSSAGGIPRTR